VDNIIIEAALSTNRRILLIIIDEVINRVTVIEIQFDAQSVAIYIDDIKENCYNTFWRPTWGLQQQIDVYGYTLLLFIILYSMLTEIM
jgi:hypothetical protein